MIKKSTIQELIKRKRELEYKLKFVSGMKNKKSISKIKREYSQVKSKLKGVEDKFPCRWCDEKFESIVGLNNHERSHKEFEDLLKEVTQTCS